jgi:HAD superfamily hydrolase (TIGR01490 family)
MAAPVTANLPGGRLPADAAASGAAFFDLDRTLIRRSSMLALAPTLKRHGLIGWRSLARASVWHAVYLVRGVSSKELSNVAEQTFRLMRGWPVEQLQQLIAEQIEPLAALAFPDAITRMRAHQARGERAIVVSSSLSDLVEPLALRLGLDGAIASRAGVADGRYTGRIESFLHGAAKADAVRAYAAEHGIELAASSAYTDSRSDVQLLHAVGHPYAVNPDRALQRTAEAEHWPVLRFASSKLTLAEAEAALLLDSEPSAR